MTGGLFAFLDGISPWWWVALALALGAVEVMTFTYYLLWPALAAASVALALVISPELGGTTQVTLLAVLTLLYTVLGWAFLRRFRQAKGLEANGLNQRSSRLVGRRARVSGAFEAGFGWVTVDGERWRARLTEGAAAPDPDAELKITGAEGMTLVVIDER